MSNTQIVRLYTRKESGVVADVTLDPTKNAEVVMEVEAGEADWISGALFEVGLSIAELDGTALVGYTPIIPYTGSMTMAPWTIQAQPFIFKISAAELGGHDGHVCQAYGHLLVGAVNREAFLVKSPPFLIHK